MRATWITLLLLAIVPATAFFVLDWSGGTAALRFIATTNWKAGAPSMGEVIQMLLSVLTWIWVKGFMNVFLFAAIPFLALDIRRIRMRKRADVEAQVSPQDREL